MALAGPKVDLQTWQIVQHEGFHQFAHAGVGDRLPAWLEEGLAEYFGESLFTGRGYVSGVMPGWRVERVKKGIEGKQLMPWSSWMLIEKREWGKRLKQADYDEAWAGFPKATLP